MGINPLLIFDQLNHNAIAPSNAAFATFCLALPVLIAIVAIRPWENKYGKIREKTKRRERELEALNEVAMAVGRSMDLKQILHNALLSVTKIGNFGIGFIYLLNQEKNVLDLVASYGRIPDNLAKRLSCLNLGQEV